MGIINYINSPLPLRKSPSGAYMRQWIVSASVQIMACPPFGTKPLSKPMLGYCRTRKSKFQWNSNGNTKLFIHEYALVDVLHFPDNFFKCIFFNENVWISIKISPKFVPGAQLTSIGSDDDLAPVRRQAIIWINVCLVYLRIYTHASLGINELSKYGGSL